MPFLTSVYSGSALMSQKDDCVDTVVFHLLIQLFFIYCRNLKIYLTVRQFGVEKRLQS